MYSLTDKGKAGADRIDEAHDAEEAIPVIMSEYPPGATLEAVEIAALTNLEEDKAESVLRRLTKKGWVTNLNPSEPSESGKKRRVFRTKDGDLSYHREEKESTKAKDAGNAAVGVMKGLGKAAIAAVKYINKDPGVVGRAVVGSPKSSRVVFGTLQHKRLNQDRKAVLRGRRY